MYRVICKDTMHVNLVIFFHEFPDLSPFYSKGEDYKYDRGGLGEDGNYQIPYREIIRGLL